MRDFFRPEQTNVQNKRPTQINSQIYAPSDKFFLHIVFGADRGAVVEF